MLTIVCAAYQHVTTLCTPSDIRGIYIIVRFAMIIPATMVIIFGVSKYLSPGIKSIIYGDTLDNKSLWLGGAYVLLACILASRQMTLLLVGIILGN